MSLLATGGWQCTHSRKKHTISIFVEQKKKIGLRASGKRKKVCSGALYFSVPKEIWRLPSARKAKKEENSPVGEGHPDIDA